MARTVSSAFDGFGKSGPAAFIDGLSEQIEVADRRDQNAAKAAAAQTMAAETWKQGMDAASTILSQLFANTLDPRYGDDHKVEEVKRFVVEEMGVKGKKNIEQTVIRLVNTAKRIPISVDGGLDKLLYLIMQMRAARDKPEVLKNRPDFR